MMTAITNFAEPYRAVENNPLVSLTQPVGETDLKERIAVSKLDKMDIFDQIRSKMCLVKGKHGRTSGFFVDNAGLLVTPFHCLSITALPNNQFSVNPGELTITYDNKDYSVVFPTGFNVTRAKELDLCLLRIKNAESIVTDCFDPLPSSVPIREGMKTYFAGFPLTQTSITFHTGSISSIFEKNKAQYLTIDGTVVPGNSGGPVVVQNNGNLYLAGIIFAEVVDIDPRFLQAQADLKPLLDRATLHIGGVSFNDLMSQVIDTIFSNMSTGIGKAIHCQHIYELCSHQVTIPALTVSFTQIDGTELPVMKKTALEKALKNLGWFFSRNGGKHDIWTNGTRELAVPRHTEIKNGTAFAILKEAQENPGTV